MGGWGRETRRQIIHGSQDQDTSLREARQPGQEAMNDNHSRKYSFLLKGGNHQTVLLGDNSIDARIHISQQLLFNICSFSRCLAQWTKCYGNLSVLCREVLPVWMMVGLASTVCHVHLEPNSLARPGQWSCWPLTQYIFSPELII